MSCSVAISSSAYRHGRRMSLIDLLGPRPLISKLLSLSLICESKQVSVVTQSSLRRNANKRPETLTIKPEPRVLAQGSGSFSNCYTYAAFYGERFSRKTPLLILLVLIKFVQDK